MSLIIFPNGRPKPEKAPDYLQCVSPRDLEEMALHDPRVQMAESMLHWASQYGSRHDFDIAHKNFTWELDQWTLRQNEIMHERVLKQARDKNISEADATASAMRLVEAHTRSGAPPVVDMAREQEHAEHVARLGFDPFVDVEKPRSSQKAEQLAEIEESIEKPGSMLDVLRSSDDDVYK